MRQWSTSLTFPVWLRCLNNSWTSCRLTKHSTCMSRVAGLFRLLAFCSSWTERFGVHVKCHNFVYVTGDCDVFRFHAWDRLVLNQEDADDHDDWKLQNKVHSLCQNGFSLVAARTRQFTNWVSTRPYGSSIGILFVITSGRGMCAPFSLSQKKYSSSWYAQAFRILWERFRVIGGTRDNLCAQMDWRITVWRLVAHQRTWRSPLLKIFSIMSGKWISGLLLWISRSSCRWLYIYEGARISGPCRVMSYCLSLNHSSALSIGTLHAEWESVFKSQDHQVIRGVDEVSEFHSRSSQVRDHCDTSSRYDAVGTLRWDYYAHLTNTGGGYHGVEFLPERSCPKRINFNYTVP